MAISDADEVTPGIDPSSEIVVLSRCDKQFSGIVVSYPSIIKSKESSLGSTNLWEISLNKCKFIVETSVFGLTVVVFDSIDNVSDNLRNPFFVDLIFPVQVEGFYCYFKVVFLVVQFFVLPFIKIF